MCLGYRGSGWAKREMCSGANDVTPSRAAEIGSVENMLREVPFPREFIPPNPKRISQVDGRDRGNREKGS